MLIPSALDARLELLLLRELDGQFCALNHILCHMDAGNVRFLQDAPPFIDVRTV